MAMIKYKPQSKMIIINDNNTNNNRGLYLNLILYLPTPLKTQGVQIYIHRYMYVLWLCTVICRRAHKFPPQKFQPCNLIRLWVICFN